MSSRTRACSRGHSAVTSNRHVCLSCLVTWTFFTCHAPCSFWDSPGFLSLPTTSHFPQCVYSFGLLPGSFYHLRILLPALISCMTFVTTSTKCQLCQASYVGISRLWFLEATLPILSYEVFSEKCLASSNHIIDVC